MQESSLFGARFFSSCKIRALQGFCSHKPKSGFWRTLAGGTAIQVANKSQSAGISLPSASLSLSLSRVFCFNGSVVASVASGGDLLEVAAYLSRR